MSANTDVLRASDLIGSRADDAPLRKAHVLSERRIWNPEHFAREQIRSLVRRVFFDNCSIRLVKQVVFSAAGPDSDVAAICEQVAQALSLETADDVAVVIQAHGERECATPSSCNASTAIKSYATRIATNLWRVPECGMTEHGEESTGRRHWLSRLESLRNEFEYSVIHAPVAGMSSDAAVLAELADGVILVVGAHTTRRACARKIKETLAAGRAQILGTVLSGRSFPIPEQIYRRL
jgi:hypothetical protein